MGEPGANVIAYISALLGFASAILALPVYVENALERRVQSLRDSVIGQASFIKELEITRIESVKSLIEDYENLNYQSLPSSAYRPRITAGIIIFILLILLTFYMVYDLYGIGDIILLEQIILLISIILCAIALDAGVSYFSAVRFVQAYNQRVQSFNANMSIVKRNI